METYLSKVEAATALGVTVSRINGALRARPDLAREIAGRTVIAQSNLAELGQVIESRRPGRKATTWRPQPFPLPATGEVAGTIFYRKEHAGVADVLLVPPTRREVVVWLLEALAKSSPCGCCHPTFYCDDGTDIQVCPPHERADCPECMAELAEMRAAAEDLCR